MLWTISEIYGEPWEQVEVGDDAWTRKRALRKVEDALRGDPSLRLRIYRTSSSDIVCRLVYCCALMGFWLPSVVVPLLWLGGLLFALMFGGIVAMGFVTLPLGWLDWVLEWTEEVITPPAVKLWLLSAPTALLGYTYRRARWDMKREEPIPLIFGAGTLFMIVSIATAALTLSVDRLLVPQDWGRYSDSLPRWFWVLVVTIVLAGITMYGASRSKPVSSDDRLAQHEYRRKMGKPTRYPIRL